MLKKTLLFIGHGTIYDPSPMIAKFCSPETWFLVTGFDKECLQSWEDESTSNILTIDNDKKVKPDIVMDINSEWKELSTLSFDSIIDTMVCESMHLYSKSTYWKKISQHLQVGGYFLGCANMIHCFDDSKVALVETYNLKTIENTMNHFVLQKT